MSFGGTSSIVQPPARLMLGAATIAALVTAAWPADTQETSCEMKQLEVGDALRYRQHDDRCEGLYTRKTASGESLHILGFHVRCVLDLFE
ncbi:MAG: hypothetical protein AB7S71_04715 [Dongiaceae bacterium]